MDGLDTVCPAAVTDLFLHVFLIAAMLDFNESMSATNLMRWTSPQGVNHIQGYAP